MKKIVLALIVFASFANVSAQLKLDVNGNVGIGKDPTSRLDVNGDISMGSASNILGTTNSNSITFKVNNVLAGFTGYYSEGNVSFGYRALPNSSLGGYNTAIGSCALLSNTMIGTATGNYNTAIGSSALYYNTTGISNTATGVCALYINTGSYNTAYGHQALMNNTTGSFNTAIGYGTGWDSPNNLTNSTAIGYQATATASNQVVIGNTSINKIGGYSNWYNLSDGRAKKNMKADVPGLAFINLLQPVTYNLDLDEIDNLLGIDKAKKDKLEKDMPPGLKDKVEKAKKDKQDEVQTGFVAQDVEKAAKKVGYNFNGVNVDEEGIYSLSYAEFVVPLVKAVQELSEKNDAKDAAIASLQAQVDKLSKRIEQLENKK